MKPIKETTDCLKLKNKATRHFVAMDADEIYEAEPFLKAKALI